MGKGVQYCTYRMGCMLCAILSRVIDYITEAILLDGFVSVPYTSSVRFNTLLSFI